MYLIYIISYHVDPCLLSYRLPLTALAVTRLCLYMCACDLWWMSWSMLLVWCSPSFASVFMHICVPARDRMMIDISCSQSCWSSRSLNCPIIHRSGELQCSRYDVGIDVGIDGWTDWSLSCYPCFLINDMYRFLALLNLDWQSWYVSCQIIFLLVLLHLLGQCFWFYLGCQLLDTSGSPVVVVSKFIQQLHVSGSSFPVLPFDLELLHACAILKSFRALAW